MNVLIDAVRSKSYDDVASLIGSAELDLNLKSEFGMTALHYAVKLGMSDIVKLLLDAGANINITNNSNETPLHLTCYKKRLTGIAKMLLDAGADTEVRSKMCGSTVLHFAAAGGHTNIVKLLLDAGADKDAENNYEDTPKSLANEFKHYDTLALFK